MAQCKCKGCDKRTMYCHSICEDYAAFRRDIEEKKKFAEFERKTEGYFAERKKRQKKR